MVKTSEGKVRGERVRGVEAFRGVPYAAPPVGKRRFAPPAPARERHRTLDATGITPPCPQLASSNGPTALGEDCLLLDVWRPRRSHRRKLPVLFWIHGGGYENGSAGQHDPSRMVRSTDTIVVNINYRLGAFGWLSLPSLDAEQRDVSGNAGFQDQQAALRWVNRNVSRFGGDRSNITIAGESAGGFAVCEHLTSAGSRGLFERAIIQSGWCPSRTHDEALEQGAATAQALGCTDPATAADCLRGKDVSELLEGWQGDARPVVGGRAHPIAPAEAIDSGRFNRVPTVIGNTRDEFKFVKLGNPDMTADELRAAVAGLYPADADAILAEYDGAYPTPADTFSAVINDPGICGIHELAGDLSRATPTWHYEFDDQDPPPEVGIDINIGAYHSSELQYLFEFARSDGTVKYQRGLDAAERRLAAEMIGYWGRFAERGRPGRGWPRFTLGTPLVLRFQPGGSEVVSSYDADHHCGFWRSLGVPLEFRL